MVNPTYYAIQINTFQIPSSLPLGFTENWIGFPTTPYNPPLTILSNFNNIIIYRKPAGFITSFNSTSTYSNGLFNTEENYSVLSSDFGLTPNVQPNRNVLFSVSNINNKYAIPSSIIYSLSPSVTIGNQIIEKFVKELA